MATRVLTVGLSGPLAGHGAGFAEWLTERGYTYLSSCNQLRLLAHLSRWLEGEGWAADDFGEALGERFAKARRAAGYTGFRTARALAPALAYLRAAGVVLEEAPRQVTGPLDRLLERFAKFLVEERGLTAGSAARYQAVAREFLADRVDGDAVKL